MQSAKTLIAEAYQSHCERQGKPPNEIRAAGDVVTGLNFAIIARPEAMAGFGFVTDVDGALSYDGVLIVEVEDFPPREVRAEFKEHPRRPAKAKALQPATQ